jgi:hypothetical protein
MAPTRDLGSKILFGFAGAIGFAAKVFGPV